MDIEVQKIETLYRKDFSNFIDTMENLSLNKTGGTNLVHSKILAYDFDKIKGYLYRTSPIPTSADALYFNNTIAFIEFKDGIKVEGKNNNKYIKNCEESAKDSMMAHRLFMSFCSTNHINNSAIKTLFIVVINSSTSASRAYANALAKRTNLETSIKKRLKNKFTGKDLFGNDTFYSDIDVWNDINFDIKLAQI